MQPICFISFLVFARIFEQSIATKRRKDLNSGNRLLGRQIFIALLNCRIFLSQGLTWPLLFFAPVCQSHFAPLAPVEFLRLKWPLSNGAH